jgi:branched-chain amino acid transport system permease protein
MGVGAYTSAILSIKFGLGVLITLPMAMIVSGLLAFVISLIAVRTVEDYFVVCTLAIQIALFSAMNNLISLTNGPFGIVNISPIQIFGYQLADKSSYLVFSAIVCVLIYLLFRNLVLSGYTKLLLAIREDEIFSQSIGINTYRLKIKTFTVGAMVASVAGVLLAHYTTYIDPYYFTVNESIFILAIVLVGGMGSLHGVAAASVAMILVPELLRLVGLPTEVAANLRQIVYGIAIVLIVLFRTQTKKPELETVTHVE